MQHPLAYFCIQLLFGLIFVGGIGGNALVIFVVKSYSKMHTVTNFYILNLAMADTLYLFGLPFLLVTSQLGNWIFGNVVCKFYMVVSSLNQFTSCFFLSIMSADRYLAVCHPISAQKYRTSFVSRTSALTAWACAALMIVPVFMYSTTFEIEDQVHCNIFWSSSSMINGQTLFTLYTLILSFILPFIFIFIFYGLVIFKLHKLKSRPSVGGKKSQRRVTRLVLALICVYATCYLPYWSLQVSLFFVPPRSSTPLPVLSLPVSSCSPSQLRHQPASLRSSVENFNESSRGRCSCLQQAESLQIPHNETFHNREKTRHLSRH
ncbi:UNVERIFIED_CONTAM: hypothetical protein GTU68_036509 [Idotea baltica]|nr:hypothetical protein [Idotea baltica]